MLESFSLALSLVGVLGWGAFMPSNLTVLVDCDGVLSDCVDTLVRVCNSVNGTSYEVSDAQGQWDVDKALHLDARQSAFLWGGMNLPGVAASMEPIPGAIKGILALMDSHIQVVICTSPMATSPTWAYERAQWIREYIGDIPIISTASKHLCRGDYLVDDRLENVQDWVTKGPPGARAVWWGQARTDQPKGNPRIDRLADWDALRSLLCL